MARQTLDERRPPIHCTIVLTFERSETPKKTDGQTYQKLANAINTFQGWQYVEGHRK